MPFRPDSMKTEKRSTRLVSDEPKKPDNPLPKDEPETLDYKSAGMTRRRTPEEEAARRKRFGYDE